MRLFIIPTGTANLASVRVAFRALGADPQLVGGPQDVERAELLVLPGVGAFAAGMAALRQGGLVEPLRARIAAGRPTLAICLGHQLLAEGSEESPGVPGLGVVPHRVRRLPGGVPVPQLGWNGVRAEPGCRLIGDGAAYFANSYALFETPDSWQVARTRHGASFVAAMERGRVLSCQLHPELSGDWGLSLLRRWLEDRPVTEQLPAPRALTRRVIPCLDVRDGRVVKGVRFQGLRDAGDPAEQAARYAEQGADELVVLDVSATPEGRANAAETVRAVRERIRIPLTVGGGVRRVEDAARLLDAGADKVGVNTAAVERPALLGELAERFGRQCVVLALDAARAGEGWEVVTRSGKERTGRDAVDWAREATALGAGEILLTSWDRDGTRSGYDTALIGAISRAVEVPVIASGGANTAQHLVEALAAGADAVLAASIFHDGDTTVFALKAQLAAAGVEIR